jgi:hypothetical protein
VNFPFESERIDNEIFERLDASAKTIESFQIALDPGGYGSITFTPQDHNVAWGSGIIYKLEIDGMTSEGYPIRLGTIDPIGAFIPSLFPLRLEEILE